MKVLILGSNGMLGSDLSKVFVKDAVYWTRKDLDITNQNEVRAKLVALHPDIVINAAAYTAVDNAETNKDLAFKVNAYAVKTLAQVSREIGAALIHYSTDYVFPGEKIIGYDEPDFQEPLNIYGESKAKGEEFLEAEGRQGLKFYLVRSSWMFGEHGKNFVRTIINLAKEKPELKIVSDQRGKPTFTVDLTNATKDLIKENPPFGIYHLSNEGEVSWYDFGKAAIELAKQKSILTKTPEIISCTSEEFPRPAKRPKHSVLNNNKFKKLRPWQEALEEYIYAHS